jgi:hypothetical protein
MMVAFFGEKSRHLKTLKFIPRICFLGERIKNLTSVKGRVAGAPDNIQ